MKNNDMRNRNRERDSSVADWDLSQIELHEDRNFRQNNIPTIDLEDDDEHESTSAREEVSLRGIDMPSSRVRTFPTNIRKSPASPRVHAIPVAVQRDSDVIGTSAGATGVENVLVRRSIHDQKGIFGISPVTPATQAPAGIILNRSYNKNPTPKENYFSVLNTSPPSFGFSSTLNIFSPRSTSTEPKTVITSNHYERKIIRRSVEKPGVSLPSSTVTRRQEKNNGPYKLLGVIDLEPDTESETTDDRSVTPSVLDTPKSRGSINSRMDTTPANPAGVTHSDFKLCSSKENNTGIFDGTVKNLLTIEIDEDEERHNEDEESRMELSEVDDGTTVEQTETDNEPTLRTSKTRSSDELHVEQCTLSDSDSSSTAQMEPTSMVNSFCDVSSSGCVKMTDSNRSIHQSNKYTEFDLLLDKINQQVPAMSQQDRIEQWRVTKEDLLYSIPTVAEIESSTSVKRPLDDPIHISSSDSSSDSETSDSPSLLRIKQQRSHFKKRRIADDQLVGDRSSPLIALSEDLDFRRCQINPEIDKRASMIQLRKNYHKFPTRFKRLLEDEAGEKTPEDPYVNFLKNDVEKEKLAGYLRKNPAYHSQLGNQSCQLDENKVAVVVLSPLEVQTSCEPSANNSDTRQRSERAESADRISRYGKSGTKSAGRTVRYKARKPLLKKKPLRVVSSKLRSYRRLIMKTSLRNGKVRKKQSFINLISASKQKRQSCKGAKRNYPKNCDSRHSVTKPSEGTSQKRRSKEQHAQPNRLSVDSAVSSSTSAEQKGHETVAPTVQGPAALRTMKNPLSRSNGEVLMIYYVFNKLIAIQQELVSFWEVSKLCTLLGLQQELRSIGEIKRSQTDLPIDATNMNRLGFNEEEPFYLEPRARDLNEDGARTCPLASIYINCYYESKNEEGKDIRSIKMKSLQLDSVRSELSNILFVSLPKSRYFIICWHEQMSENDFRTGLCKYSLTPDLETIASIREFPIVEQRILCLKSVDSNRIIGLGNTSIAIWNYENGHLIFTVDLKIDIQMPLTAFTHTENNESALFLVQLLPSPSGNQCSKLIRVIGINMNKRSWHLVHNYEVALESNTILCESSTLNSTNVHCTTFQSGELLAISLDDLTTCFSNYKRLQGPDGRRVTRDIVAAREKIFLHPAENRQLVLVTDKFIKLNTIDEYSLMCR